MKHDYSNPLVKVETNNTGLNRNKLNEDRNANDWLYF